jgi:hypothetical protein
MNRENRENRLLLTDEPVEVQDMSKTYSTDLLRGIRKNLS